MANTILLKRSSVPGKIPSSTDLAPGELAINTADEKLYFKNSAGDVVEYKTTEHIQDIVGAMTSGNTESGITVSYQDLDGTIDFELTQTGVTAGTYGSSTSVPILTVDSQGRITVADSATLTTSNIVEGTNLYYTNSRATDDARAAVSASGDLAYNPTTGRFSVTTYKTTDFDTDFASKSTTDLTEGTNLYYTDGRVRAAISGGTGVTYNASTGQFSIGQPVATTSNVTFNDVTVNGSLHSDDITAATMTASGDVVIQGNLTINGTTTTINAETLNLADNLILLNSNETGTPTQNAGIEIERGTSQNKSLYWDETNDRWSVGSDSFAAGSIVATTVTGNLTGDVTGNASTASTLKTARTIALTGDVTGSVSFNGGSNVSITTAVANDSHSHDGRYYTETEADSRFVNVTGDTLTGALVLAADPVTNLQAATKQYVDSQVSSGTVASANQLTTARTIALGGDLSGSATFDGSANVTITATVADDSHNHTIANVDGLQTALDSKLDSSSYTAADVLAKLLTVDGAGSGLDADTLDGLNSAAFLRSNAADTHSGTITPATNNTINLGSSTLRYNTVFATTFNGTSTTAQYADLAECYEADAEYAPGTVLFFGGEKEVTSQGGDNDHRVAGVVSTNPAHVMNSALDAEHVAVVALRGRVPCRVTGSVRKGDLMVSAGNGIARAETSPAAGAIIGKALQDFDGTDGIVEIVVG
jgi:hypothetical protein